MAKFKLKTGKRKTIRSRKEISAAVKEAMGSGDETSAKILADLKNRIRTTNAAAYQPEQSKWDAETCTGTYNHKIHHGELLPKEQKPMEEKEHLYQQLIEIHKDYEKLLGDEIHELVSIAIVRSHGWKSTRHEQGIELREKIAQLEAKINGK